MPVQKAKAAPLDREELERQLYAIGRLRLDIEQVEAEMNGQIDRIKKSFVGRIEPRLARLKDLEQKLRLACEDSRQDLLPKGRKSIKTLFGKMGWRRQGDKIVLQKGLRADDVAEAVGQAGYPELVRMKAELDKEAIKSAMGDDPKWIRTLAPLGILLSPAGEDWYYEIDRASVAKHLEEAA